jgi:hypothetical protein
MPQLPEIAGTDRRNAQQCAGQMVPASAAPNAAVRRPNPRHRRPVPRSIRVSFFLIAGLAVVTVSGCSQPWHSASPAQPSTPMATMRPMPSATAVQPSTWQFVPAGGATQAKLPADSILFPRNFGGFLAYVPPAGSVNTPSNWHVQIDGVHHFSIAYPPDWTVRKRADGSGSAYLPPGASAQDASPGGSPGIVVLWTATAATANTMAPLPASGDAGLLDEGTVHVGRVTGHLITYYGAPSMGARVQVAFRRSGVVTIFVHAETPAILDTFREMLASLHEG